MKAYDSYDSKQGAKFSHYAYIQIESEINFEITKTDITQFIFQFG